MFYLGILGAEVKAEDEAGGNEHMLRCGGILEVPHITAQVITRRVINKVLPRQSTECHSDLHVQALGNLWA